MPARMLRLPECQGEIQNPILKSGTTPADSYRMPLKVSQNVRSAKPPFHVRGGQGSNPPIRDRKTFGFQRISNFLTVNGVSTCETPENH